MTTQFKKDEVLDAVASLKLLLLKYNIVHHDLLHQFNVMTIACSQHSLGGKIFFNLQNRRFVCKIYTDLFFIRKVLKNGSNRKVQYYAKQMSKSMKLKLLKSLEYKKAIQEIVKNLNSWIRYWTWGQDTYIMIKVDKNIVYKD